MSLSTTMQQGAVQSQSKTSLKVWAERVLWMAWIPLVLLTVFFVSIPDVHNGMHPLRHAPTIVQCH
ncbi:MAG: CbtB-domain containing protein [Mariprofundaceae bacterium]|nr:CbtB-domain containing protein [Mariprofundaceae bacterium]